jgi:hypothetical protein
MAAAFTGASYAIGSADAIHWMEITGDRMDARLLPATRAVVGSRITCRFEASCDVTLAEYRTRGAYGRTLMPIASAYIDVGGTFNASVFFWSNDIRIVAGGCFDLCNTCRFPLPIVQASLRYAAVSAAIP